jgi:hypothetical protein
MLVSDERENRVVCVAVRRSLAVIHLHHRVRSQEQYEGTTPPALPDFLQRMQIRFCTGPRSQVSWLAHGHGQTGTAQQVPAAPRMGLREITLSSTTGFTTLVRCKSCHAMCLLGWSEFGGHSNTWFLQPSSNPAVTGPGWPRLNPGDHRQRPSLTFVQRWFSTSIPRSKR